MGAKALPVHPSHQGVCGRHGTEDDVVTHGDLVASGKNTAKGRCIKIAGVEVAAHTYSVQTSVANR